MNNDYEAFKKPYEEDFFIYNCKRTMDAMLDPMQSGFEPLKRGIFIQMMILLKYFPCFSFCHTHRQSTLKNCKYKI